MGYLHIGHAGFLTAIDDRALAHLKVIILSSLRKGQPLSFTLKHAPAEGGGRDTFWIHAGTDLRFQFLGGRPPHLNRTWLKLMAESCTGTTGLYIMDEPIDDSNDDEPTSAKDEVVTTGPRR